MRRFLLSVGVLFFFFSATPTVSAQTNASLLSQINVLWERVAELQSALVFQSQQSVVQEAPGTAYSEIYDGSYEKVYGVNGRTLWSSNGRVIRPDDLLFWDAFVSVVGDSFVQQYINEFRVFNDPDDGLGAFMEPKSDGRWMVGFNRDGGTFSELLTYDDTYELIIHEFAHLYFDEHFEIRNAFKDTFWSSGTIQKHARKIERISNREAQVLQAESYFDSHQSDFVSSYAALSSIEDLAETFTAFVYADSLYRDDTLQNTKMLFFNAYSELRVLRNSFREKLAL